MRADHQRHTCRPCSWRVLTLWLGRTGPRSVLGSAPDCRLRHSVASAIGALGASAVVLAVLLASKAYSGIHIVSSCQCTNNNTDCRGSPGCPTGNPFNLFSCSTCLCGARTAQGRPQCYYT